MTPSARLSATIHLLLPATAHTDTHGLRMLCLPPHQTCKSVKTLLAMAVELAAGPSPTDTK
jgi:hypothetical protein